MKAAKWRWVDAFQSDDGPRHTIRHLLLCLGARMDKDGERCYPGMRLIAQEMGVQLGTVSGLVAEAAAEGWLEIERRTKGKRGGVYFAYRPRVPDRSVRRNRTVEALDAPERFDPGSVRADEGTVRGDTPEVLDAAERTGPVVPQRSSHENFPHGGIADAMEEERPSPGPPDLSPVQEARNKLYAEGAALFKRLWPDMAPWHRTVLVDHYVNGTMLTVPDALPPLAELLRDGR